MTIFIVYDPYADLPYCTCSLKGKSLLDTSNPLIVLVKLTLADLDVSKEPLACKRSIAALLHVFHFTVRELLPDDGRTVKLSFKHAELEIDDVDLPSDPNDMVELLMHYPIWAKALTTGSDDIVFALTYYP